MALSSFFLSNFFQDRIYLSGACFLLLPFVTGWLVLIFFPSRGACFCTLFFFSSYIYINSFRTPGGLSDRDIPVRLCVFSAR